MTNDNGISALKQALAVSVSVLSSEHVFSAALSSPWTTGKLSQTEEDEAAFWTLFTECVFASYIFAITTGLILTYANGGADGKKDFKPLIWSLAGTTAVVIWLYFDYKRALDGDLYET